MFGGGVCVRVGGYVWCVFESVSVSRDVYDLVCVAASLFGCV